MLEHRRSDGPLPVSHWVRQPAIDLISAVDALSRVVMTITTGPGFGMRLAAAFHNVPQPSQGYSANGPWPPAFPP